MSRNHCRHVWLCLLLVVSPLAAQDWAIENVDRVVAVADVHGDYERLVDLLQDLEVVDASLNWSGGETHLVSTGDIVDRGARSRDVLDLLMKLQAQAPRQGGRVLMTLGNHEIMNLQGDLRYVSREEFAAFAEPQADAQYPDMPPGFIGHREAFSATGKYGSWLLEQPLVVKVNDTVFVHGGLPPYLAAFDLDWVNTDYRADFRRFVEVQTELTRMGLLDPRKSDDEQVNWARLMLHGESGFELNDRARALLGEFMKLFDATVLHGDSITWYRGTALCHPFPEDIVLSAVLERYGARQVVMGHTGTGGEVVSRLNGRAILLDTGMLKEVYGGRPSALVISDDGIRVFYGDTDEWNVPVPEKRSDLTKLNGLDDKQIEEFLRTADVVQVEDIGTGVTRPKRLTLEKGDFRLRALFKFVEEGMTPEMLGDRRMALDYSDSYRYEVAAYRLDRILNLNMVPPAVLRTVDGRQGAVQLWIENGIHELERRQKEIPINSWCRINDEYELMNLFDALIYNVDRSLANIFYRRSDWRVRLIDHSRAFRTKSGRPADVRKLDLKLPPAFAAQLEALEKDALKAELGDLLDPMQVRAIWKRRSEMLKRMPRKQIEDYLRTN